MGGFENSVRELLSGELCHKVDTKNIFVVILLVK